MSELIIKGIETNSNITVDLILEISRYGLIKKITFKKITFNNESSVLLSTVKIPKLVLPEKDGNNKPINGIGMQAFASKKMCSISELIIPNSYTTIESFAFKKANISKIIWSNAVAKIPPHCFEESTIESIENIDNVLEIGEFAFSHCYYLKQISLPDNITKIQEEAFQGTGLETIIWPSNIKCIPKNCFFGCKSFNSIYNIENVENIESGAFSYTALDTFNWPPKCHIIPSMCFDGSELRTINISLATKTLNINEYAFRWTNITELDLTNLIGYTNKDSSIKVISPFYSLT